MTKEELQAMVDTAVNKALAERDAVMATAMQRVPLGRRELEQGHG